ncbi:MAG: MFS transporter, partial [Acidimicrobiia bacterium]|nr:MFS transporter [Acidimicrobiia bacterium]
MATRLGTTAAVGASTADPAVRERVGMFAALRIPSYTPLLVAGWLWNISRWGTGFLGAYLANQLTGSARLVQLTGVALWAPLLVGGVAGGLISDRFDRQKAVTGLFLVLIPLALAMGIAGVADAIELWMVYPFLFVMGIGWVLDMTCRRALVYDVVGGHRIDNAMALESVSTSSGLALGSLVGGSAIQAIGVGPAFLCIAVLLSGALVSFRQVPKIDRVGAAATERPLRALRSAFGLLKTERALLSVLGITAVVNFFFFSFTPLIQLIGSDLGANAFLTGLLAAMMGVGMMIGSSIVARFQPRRRGLVYVGGSALAMGVLVLFALAPWYLGALAALVVSATGMGLFGSTQGTLVMTSVDAERRGRALGLLSMAIGVLPAGMI